MPFGLPSTYGFYLDGDLPYPLNNRRFVTVQLTDVELNLLDQGAACFSISRSEYLRKLLLEKQINHQIEVVADMNDLRKLVSEYGMIGSNLNQIANTNIYAYLAMLGLSCVGLGGMLYFKRRRKKS